MYYMVLESFVLAFARWAELRVSDRSRFSFRFGLLSGLELSVHCTLLIGVRSAGRFA